MDTIYFIHTQKYIIGALYNGLTKHYPIQKSSQTERRKRKQYKVYDFETCGKQTDYPGQTWYLGKYNSLSSLLELDKMVLNGTFGFSFIHYHQAQNASCIINLIMTLM